MESFGRTLDSLETGGWYSNVGVGCGLKLNSQLIITAGLELDSYGHKIDSLREAQLHSVRYRYRNIGIPLGIQYRVNKSKAVMPIFGLVLMPSKLIAQSWSYRRYTANTKEVEETDMNLNEFQLQVSLTAGMCIALHPKYNFCASVGYYRNLLSLSTYPIERYYQKVGLQVSLNRSF